MPEYIDQPGGGAAVSEKTRLARPRRHKVLLHNDHYTTMEFVVMVLEQVFRKSRSEAVRVMLDVHENGIGLAGVYARAVAEAKVARVHALAEAEGFPLKCSMEPE